MSRRECSSKADFSNFQFNSNLDFIFQRFCLLENADKKSAVHWTAIPLTWSAVLTLKMWSSWWKREWNSLSICLPSMVKLKRSRLKWKQRLLVTKTRLNKINFHFCSGIYKFGLELHCSWINVEQKTARQNSLSAFFSIASRAHKCWRVGERCRYLLPFPASRSLLTLLHSLWKTEKFLSRWCETKN